MGDLVRNVTAENYAEMAGDFISLNGGTGFVIALENGVTQGVHYTQTLRQWGAWYSFFVRIRLHAWSMLKRTYYTVPAEWPSSFTSDCTVLEDAKIGMSFERDWLDNGQHRRRPAMGKGGWFFRPFPKLWEVFASDRETLKKLDSGLEFTAIEEASRRLTLDGQQAAREYLAYCHPPPLSPRSAQLMRDFEKRKPTPKEHLDPLQDFA